MAGNILFIGGKEITQSKIICLAGNELIIEKTLFILNLCSIKISILIIFRLKVVLLEKKLLMLLLLNSLETLRNLLPRLMPRSVFNSNCKSYSNWVLLSLFKTTQWEWFCLLNHFQICYWMLHFKIICWFTILS